MNSYLTVHLQIIFLSAQYMYVQGILSETTKEYSDISPWWEFAAFLWFYRIMFHNCGFVWTKQDIWSRLPFLQPLFSDI